MELSTFRTFPDAGAARELAGWLRDRGITAEVGDSPAYFHPSFTNSILSQSWNVVIPAHQFPEADKLLADFYEMQLANVPADYYLFAFSDDELRAIFAAPDNWGDLDKVLAERLLRERGNPITPEDIKALAQQRNASLGLPETAGSDATALWGYGLCLASAVFCTTRYGAGLGIVAILLGSLMMRSSKTLPDGRIVDRYDKSGKMQGRRIVILAILAILLGFAIRLMPLLQAL